MERHTSPSAARLLITVSLHLGRSPSHRLDFSLPSVASTNPESGLMPSSPGQAAEVRNWLFICEAEVHWAFDNPLWTDMLYLRQIIAPLTVINRAHGNLVPYDQKVRSTIGLVLSSLMCSIGFLDGRWHLRKSASPHGKQLAPLEASTQLNFEHSDEYRQLGDQSRIPRWRSLYPR